MVKGNTNLGDEIAQSLNEVKDHIKGKITLSHREVNLPKQINVKEIRRKFGYTQNEFALHFGFTASAIKDWEQGRRTPERSARILLTIIDKDPKVVEKTLNSFL